TQSPGPTGCPSPRLENYSRDRGAGAVAIGGKLRLCCRNQVVSRAKRGCSEPLPRSGQMLGHAQHQRERERESTSWIGSLGTSDPGQVLQSTSSGTFEREAEPPERSSFRRDLLAGITVKSRPSPFSFTFTVTVPPPTSRPNSSSSASGFLMCSWMTRASGRAP